jgi:hypothetical protein
MHSRLGSHACLRTRMITKGMDPGLVELVRKSPSQKEEDRLVHLIVRARLDLRTMPIRGRPGYMDTIDKHSQPP